MSQPISERWLPIPGWEGTYEASDHGRVRSVEREVVCTLGRRRTLRGKVLSPCINTNGYQQVSLVRNSRGHSQRVHVLVMLAFAGHRPDGFDVCHNDGNQLNNHLSNLRWGTRSENRYDSVQHGTHVQASKTHCPQGHAYVGDNIIRVPSRPNARYCRACNREQGKLRARARRAKMRAMKEAD